MEVITRSSILGFIVGVLPGAGATIASFALVWRETSLKMRERKFGKEVFKAYQHQKPPIMRLLRIFCSITYSRYTRKWNSNAVFYQALVFNQVQDYMRQPDIFWSVIMSMDIGMVVLLILNLPLIPYIARILCSAKNITIPMILFFSVTGIYLMSFNNLFFNDWDSSCGNNFKLYDFPMPPLILAFVLGGLMEENLRRSLLISDGSWTFLWDRPLTLCIMITILLIVFWQVYSSFKLTKK